MSLARPRSIGLILIGTATLGCGHSDPFVAPDNSTDRPFDPVQPSRLTFGRGSHTSPRYSEDGRFLVYSHDHPDASDENHSPDRCVSLLPATGGRRVVTLCAQNPPVDPMSGLPPFRYGIEHAAVAATGEIAYVQHVGRVNSFGSTEAGLHLSHIEHPNVGRKVFDLKRVPPGASGRWDYLVDMTWVGPGRLVALAMEANLVPPGPFADPDTILTGVEIVEFDLSGVEPSWRQVASAPGARAIAWDAAVERVVMVRDNLVIDTRDGTILYTMPHEVGTFGEEVVAIAGGGGALYIAENRVRAFGALEATIRRLDGIGSATVVLQRIGTGADALRFGRLAIPNDARRVAFERSGGGGATLFLQDLAP